MRQVGAPAASDRNSRLAVEPWKSTRVAVARVGDRDDVRLAVVVDDRDVRDPPRVEHRVERRSVVELLSPAAAGRCARCGLTSLRQSRDHASVSTERRICSISSNCDWPQISGGASWMTGSPRSSARQ